MLIAQSKALLEELALTVWIAGPLTQFAGWIDLGRAIRPRPSSSFAGVMSR